MAIDTPAVKSTPDLSAPSFSMISKEITIENGPDGERRFHLTTSSTIEDMAGDEIEVPALQKAAEKFSKGVTIFMDHDYKHVDAAFGVTDRAEVKATGEIDPATGKPIYDLDVYGKVNVPNPRAKQLADSIDGGYVKLGASMTAFIRKHARKPGGRGMLIKDLDVVEASVVGVAENQRSWARKAALAVKSFHKPDWMTEEDDIVSKDADIETTDDANEAVEAAPLDEVAPVVDEAITADAEAATATEDEGHETVEKSASVDEDQTCPDCGSTRDASGCDNGFHSIEKSIDGNTQGVQASAADTDPAETPETAPDVADDAGADSVIEKAADVVTNAEVKELVAFVEKAVKEIEFLRGENERLVSKIATLEGEQTALATEVGQAKQVISKVLELPLRSQTAGYVTEELAGSSVFAPEVQDYLNKRRKLSNG